MAGCGAFFMLLPLVARSLFIFISFVQNVGDEGGDENAENGADTGDGDNGKKGGIEGDEYEEEAVDGDAHVFKGEDEGENGKNQ